MEDLSQVREEIDQIDDRILSLFQRRMECADKVAAYKAAHGLPVLDRSRERRVIEDAAAKVPPELRSYAQVLMQLLMEASRNRQHGLLNPEGSDVVRRIEAAASATPDLFPQDAFVACQGVEGAYSQIACDRIFHHADISFFDTFDGVFRAVEEGFCQYGVLPVENSTAGSVNQVYDLMMRHNFSIVRTCRLKIDHNLLAKPGQRKEDVHIIYSHQQAISQCADYISTFPDVRVHVTENTAMAARMVAESDRDDVAALASAACADLYGLEVLERSVQDLQNNYTRFACISRDLTIYPGADRSTLMIETKHEPGALYKVLARFYALDINLVKLESRPIPEREFDFMFYFDVDCPAAAPEFQTLMNSLSDVCEEFRYLGSYTEVL